MLFCSAHIELTLFDGKWAHKLAGELFENDLENDGGAFGPSSSNGLRKKYQYQTDLTLEAPKFLESTHALTFGVENEREEVLTKNAFAPVDRALDTISIYGNYQIGLMPEGPHVFHAELSDAYEWLLETPAEMELQGGLVIKAEEGIGK